MRELNASTVETSSVSPANRRCRASPAGHLLVSYRLFVQLLIQLLLQELELGPGLRQLCLELCYFLGMFPLLNPSIKNKEA